MKIELYKILNPETGLFSKGGLAPKQSDQSYAWSKKGKTWSSSQAVRGHLGLFIKEKWNREKRYYDYELAIPKHWVVVHIFTNEEGVLQQEEINAVEFYLQSKNTNYAKWLKAESVK